MVSVVSAVLSSIFSLPAALLLGGEEEAMPAGPGHAHPEDLPWLEVPHSLPAAEEESDSGVGLVPPIRGEPPPRHEESMKSLHKAPTPAWR